MNTASMVCQSDGGETFASLYAGCGNQLYEHSEQGGPDSAAIGRDTLDSIISDFRLAEHDSAASSTEIYQNIFNSSPAHNVVQNIPPVFLGQSCSNLSCSLLQSAEKETDSAPAFEVTTCPLLQEQENCPSNQHFPDFGDADIEIFAAKSDPFAALNWSEIDLKCPAFATSPLKRERSANAVSKNASGIATMQETEKTRDTRHVIKDVEGYYKCGFCDMQFTQFGNRTKHINEKHMRFKPFPCSVCGAAFSRKHARDTHQRAVHQKLRPHQCPFCQKTFKNRSDLNKHIRTVERKEKPFKCPLCDKSFGERGKLKRHMSVHTRFKSPSRDIPRRSNLSLKCTSNKFGQISR